MTVTYLPNQRVDDEKAQQNFEYVESHALFAEDNLAALATLGNVATARTNLGALAVGAAAGGDLVGTYPNPTVAAPTTSQINLAADTTITSTTVAGGQVFASFTVAVAGTYFVAGAFDFSGTVTGWAFAFGNLLKNGAQFGLTALMKDTGAASQRNTICQHWIVTCVATDVLKLVGSRSVAAGTLVATNTGTNMALFRIR